MLIERVKEAFACPFTPHPGWVVAVELQQMFADSYNDQVLPPAYRVGMLIKVGDQEAQWKEGDTIRFISPRAVVVYLVDGRRVFVLPVQDMESYNTQAYGIEGIR